MNNKIYYRNFLKAKKKSLLKIIVNYMKLNVKELIWKI